MAAIDTSFLTRAMLAQVAQVLQAGQGVIFNRVGEVLGEVEGLGEDLELDIMSQVEGALGDAFDEDGAILQSLDDSMQGLVAGADDELSGLIGKTEGILESEVVNATGQISDNADSIIGSIGNESTGAIDVLQDLGSAVLEDIGIGAGGALDSVESASTAILEAIGVNAQGAIDEIRDVGDAVGLTSEGILSSVTQQVEESFGNIDTSVANQTNAATEALEAHTELFNERSQQQLEASQETAEEIRRGIDESLAASTEDSERALSEVAESTDAQTRATSEGADQVASSVDEGSGMISTAIGRLADAWNPFDGDVPAEAKEAAFSQLREMLIGLEVPPDHADNLIEKIREVFGDTSGIVLRPVFGMLPMFGFFQVVSEMLRVSVTPSLQQLAKAVPSSMPGPGEVAELRNRDLLDDQLGTELLQLQGYSEPISQAYVAARRTFAEVGVIQSWFLRDFVSREHGKQLLEYQGYNDADSDMLLDMAFYIPPPQDIILWATREVFNIQQAEAFGQFEEFPQEFADLASKQGISEDFARNYWGAHWRMPSLTRLFEMYHRKIIDEDTLRLTIKSHDYTPFWRDPLIDVAFKPLTRVDIRRMHDLGLLDEQQLQERYEAIGFSPDNAGLMVQFTLEYNAEPAAESPEQIEAVARQPILNLYRDGVFLEDEARTRLVELGMPEAEANVFLEAERLEQEREDRKQQKDLVLEQAKAGALSFNEAFDQLSGLGLEPTELNRAVTEMYRARAQATKQPTRDELDTMLARELVTEDEYVEALQRMGYAPFWAQRFLALQKEQPQ